MADKIKVTVLQCGRVLIDESALFKEEGAHYPFCMAGWFRNKKNISSTFPPLPFWSSTPVERKSSMTHPGAAR